MAYDYKPGEEQDVLKRYVLVVTIVVVVAVLLVVTIYLALGIDSTTLKVLLKRLKLDPVNAAFIFGFVMAAIALWGFFRESSAGEGVDRRQTYFVLLLVVAGLLIAGNVFYKRLVVKEPEIVEMQVCPRCDGTGRARLRPEYKCRECNGTGRVKK